MSQRRIGLQPAAHVKATHSRHHDVQKDDIRRRRSGLSQALFSVLSLNGTVSTDLKLVAQQLPAARFVIDHEHTRRWITRYLWLHVIHRPKPILQAAKAMATPFLPGLQRCPLKSQISNLKSFCSTQSIRGP